ncbi:MAG: rhomboid family intramembrane serine protease [Propionibacteriaceae bacterium]|nr:rhomboid family intramembrane serine protease [Propionibacteriaceae bacterium]
MIGLTPTNTRLTSLVLISINIVVWGIIQSSGFVHLRHQVISFLGLSPQGMCTSITHPNSYYPGLATGECSQLSDGHWVPGVADGAWWQVLTSIFTHVSLAHLAMSCLTLWFLGPPLESMIGRSRFLITYLLAGFSGACAVVWLSAPQSISYGGSGALFGLMGGLLIILLLRKSDVRQLVMWLGINLVVTFAVPQVSWQAHLGGLLGGVVLGLAWSNGRGGPKKPTIGWLVVGLVGVGVMVGIVLRAWALS